jgi:uncharacterized protein DUF2795
MSQISPIDIQRHLGELDYPASKQEILEQARASGADEIVLRKLQEIPHRQYHDPSGVMKELNGDF